MDRFWTPKKVNFKLKTFQIDERVADAGKGVICGGGGEGGGV